MDTGGKHCITACFQKVNSVRNPVSGQRLEHGDALLYAVCILCLENKRKSEENPSNSQVKTKRFDSNVCIDLIVLGLPWQLTESGLKDYFQTIGNVKMATVSIRGWGKVSVFLVASFAAAVFIIDVYDDRLNVRRLPASPKDSVSSDLKTMTAKLKLYLRDISSPAGGVT